MLTSSWRPDDSELASSTKFVPLLSALFNLRGGTDGERTQFSVGESIAGAEAKADMITRPGAYEIAGRRVAVNLAPDDAVFALDEGRTDPQAWMFLTPRDSNVG